METIVEVKIKNRYGDIVFMIKKGSLITIVCYVILRADQQRRAATLALPDDSRKIGERKIGERAVEYRGAEDRGARLGSGLWKIGERKIGEREFSEKLINLLDIKLINR